MRQAQDISPEQETPPASRVATLAIAAVALIMVVALVVGVLGAVARLDGASRAGEEQLVANGLALEAEDIRHSLSPNTVWDDAVQNLDLAFDPAWARDYIGDYFWRNDRYELVYVVGGDGRAKFAFERGREAALESFDSVAPAAAGLVARIRAAERARPQPAPGVARATRDIDASTVVRRDGVAYILAASLVQTDHARNLTPSAQAPVVIVGEAIDGAFIADMTRRYLVEDMTVGAPDAPVPDGYDGVPVNDAAGVSVARLAWKPDNPVSRLLELVGAPMLAVLLTLVVAPALLIAHERRRGAALWAAMGEARLASEAKSVFLATMSHEIRTPLNGILGMVQAMARDPAAASQAERLEVMRCSGEALLAVLNDVLDLSKIEAGKLELEVIDFDLSGVLAETHDAFRALAAGKGLNLVLEPGVSGRYRGDPTRLRQILFNLVSNAIKFTEQGEVRIQADRDGEALSLSVHDSGIGIAPEVQEAVFGKFSQADSSTTRRFGGSGLGLAISQDLARLMSGTISLRSTIGKGSCFTLTVPLEQVAEAAVAAVAADAAEADFTPLRVLAAEDNAVNRLVLRTLLEDQVAELAMVENGALAVEAWAPGRWDLILMDVQMPVMDGIDASRAIRTMEAAAGAARTPILALTANAMSHQTAGYLAAGMDGQIDKPIKVERLFEALAQVAAGAVDGATIAA